MESCKSCNTQLLNSQGGHRNAAPCYSLHCGPSENNSRRVRFVTRCKMLQEAFGFLSWFGAWRSGPARNPKNRFVVNSPRQSLDQSHFLVKYVSSFLD